MGGRLVAEVDGTEDIAFSSGKTFLRACSDLPLWSEMRLESWTSIRDPPNLLQEKAAFPKEPSL